MNYREDRKRDQPIFEAFLVSFSLRLMVLYIHGAHVCTITYVFCAAHALRASPLPPPQLQHTSTTPSLPLLLVKFVRTHPQGKTAVMMLISDTKEVVTARYKFNTDTSL